MTAAMVADPSRDLTMADCALVWDEFVRTVGSLVDWQRTTELPHDQVADIYVRLHGQATRHAIAQVSAALGTHVLRCQAPARRRESLLADAAIPAGTITVETISGPPDSLMRPEYTGLRVTRGTDVLEFREPAGPAHPVTVILPARYLTQADVPAAELSWIRDHAARLFPHHDMNMGVLVLLHAVAGKAAWSAEIEAEANQRAALEGGPIQPSPPVADHVPFVATELPVAAATWANQQMRLRSATRWRAHCTLDDRLRAIGRAYLADRATAEADRDGHMRVLLGGHLTHPGPAGTTFLPEMNATRSYAYAIERAGATTATAVSGALAAYLTTLHPERKTR